MTPARGPIVGRDGAITLAAALAACLLTVGIAPVLATAAVARRAWLAPLLPREAPRRILVLGHRLKQGRPSTDFEHRLARAAELARRFPEARVVVLGGRATTEEPTEAEAGRDWLVARGVDAGRITMEPDSRHTLENLSNHRALHGTAGPETLVTSRFHLHRSMLMAEGLGLRPMPVAAEETPQIEPIRLLGEGLRVHWYLTGRALAWLLQRPAWLARIS
ncbi:YdcF family protein [Roseomonas terrae]|uniref:YdcF family protein n=1 Tax=Neoroseomonas terrae TaxID=424799 RepID=A0ABS5ENS5_9PROT|nr:YdcF family protein [Neoroseomonas terrae]